MLIPTNILDDICCRFLINLPEEQQNDIIRVCFQIELAHWFYVDFYCGDAVKYPKCKEIGMREFMRQVFNHCTYLRHLSLKVDEVLDKWRSYKQSVPTYGAILLDHSLDHVLLVQGYYASRNSWGFPKGKINEDEQPTDCAIREVLEEVGFDISSEIRPYRCIHRIIGEIPVQLYIIPNVPIEFDFKPHTRNEIRKIQWFSIWDLPLDRNDTVTCSRINLLPKNFYGVVSFVEEIRNYSRKQQSKLTTQKTGRSADCSPSAFTRVAPRHNNHDHISPAIRCLFPTTSTLQQPSRSANNNNIGRKSSPPPLDRPVYCSDQESTIDVRRGFKTTASITSDADAPISSPTTTVQSSTRQCVIQPCNAWLDVKIDCSSILTPSNQS